MLIIAERFFYARFDLLSGTLRISKLSRISYVDVPSRSCCILLAVQIRDHFSLKKIIIFFSKSFFYQKGQNLNNLSYEPEKRCKCGRKI